MALHRKLPGKTEELHWMPDIMWRSGINFSSDVKREPEHTEEVTEKHRMVLLQGVELEDLESEWPTLYLVSKQLAARFGDVDIFVIEVGLMSKLSREVSQYSCLLCLVHANEQSS
jgi:hypothetical protein